MKINGEELEFDTLKFMDYLAQKGLKPEFVALELNGKIISKAEFKSVVFQKDDSAEVGSFVGGG